MTERLTTLTDFVPLEKLGTGSFSTVYKVRRLSDSKIYALKKVKMSNLKEKQKENAVNEIRILASLNSPYIIGYKEALFEEKHNVLCIVMECADGGDLHKLIERTDSQKSLIKQQDIWRAVVHILKGLETLHSNNILHRDLKSANVFLLGSYYKLGDLNVSKVKKGHMAYTQTGTPYYASPEVWNDRPYDHKSDIWSFGCIIYEMCCRKPPFEGRDMQELNKNIQKCKIKRIPSSYSKNLQDVINLCLQKNPLLRPSASELLNHKLLVRFVQQYSTEQPTQNKSQLLGTIRMPMNPKQFHLNLPKSKYEMNNQEELHTKSKQILTSQNVTMPSKIKLSQVISKNKTEVVKSERVMGYNEIINKSLTKEKSNSQVLKSILHQFDDTQRPLKTIEEKPQHSRIISLPKTQRPASTKVQASHKDNNKAQVDEQIRKPIKSSFIPISYPGSQKKISSQKKTSAPYLPQHRYYSASKQRTPPSIVQKSMIERQRDISPILRRLELNYHIKKANEIRSKHLENSQRRPVMNRLEAKFQKYYQPSRIAVKRYGVMPSWWG